MQHYFAILSVLGALLCSALGLFTLSRNPRHPVNIGFAMGMASLALIELGSSFILFSPLREGLAISGVKLTLIGQALLPAAWIFFSTVFARADHKEILLRRAPVLIIFCIASLFFIFLAIASNFTLSALLPYESILFLSKESYLALGPLGRYFYIYLIFGLALNLAQLENTLRSSTGSTRWHIKYVVFGVGAVSAYFIYLASQTLLFSSLSLETIPLTSFVIFTSSSIMAFFIVRHRLLSVDIFVSRYVVYKSVTVLVVGLYLLTVGLITHGIKLLGLPFDYSITTLFVFISLFVLVVLFFSTTTRRSVQLFINRHFYKHKYEFRDKWMETIERISPKRTIKEIKETLIEMISENMGAKPVSLWVYDPVSKSYIKEQAEVGDSFKRIPHNHPFILYLKNKLNPFILSDIGDNSNTQDKAVGAIFSETGGVLCAPLAAGHEIIGFMMLGPDISGEPYRQDDFEFLKAVTTQAAVQIKNIRLTKELMTAKEVEAFSKMSSFIMHDLKNLTNSLSLISQNARYNMDNPEFQTDTIKTIDGTVNRMKGVIERLSTVPKGFELKKGKADIKEIIKNALKKTALPKSKDVKITVNYKADPMPSIIVDPEAIEMVILNLIINAYDAIEEAGEVGINVSLNGGYIHIKVSDNGAGMSEEFIKTALFQPFKTTKKSGFGVGLYQCKSVIEAHGGEIEVESAAGKGTVFTVKLPIR